ncbi:hypothetical protein PRIPAC_85962 [Pristionchus pacificus]|uniref:Katanin_con80 domain-containing protein n=1 Tax=Pristionchus pacificus TaxID=54126 RepID=A0A2A6CCI5_PRIPA|nr:hypothetical protein PRIPAC_85962 [Pristionchus pacificus]|eukprot:PDM75945.1 hypothetical protein PRIPAC_43788 [Pristionchus pacificus]
MDLECEITKESSESVAGLSIKEDLLITGATLKAHSLSHAGVLVWSHGDETVDHMFVSRDERSLAASSSNIIKLLDISAGRETRRLVDHNCGVTSISSFSRSPYQWLSGDDEGVCRVSDVRRHPSTLIALRQSRPVRCAYSSPDDSLIVIGDDSCLQLYDMRQRKLLSRFIHSTMGVAFHPGERLMASFGDESIIRYWDLDTLECVSQSEPFNERIINAHFSFQGESLIVCSSDGVRSLSWEPCSLEWNFPHHTPSSLMYSHLDKDDKIRLIISDPLTNTIKVLSSTLIQMESSINDRKDDDEIEDVSRSLELLSSPLSPVSSPLPCTNNTDVMLLNNEDEEERSLRVVSQSPIFQSTVTKSSSSNTNKLPKTTCRMTNDDEKRRKMDERKGSMKKAKDGKTSVDIMSMIDMEHSSVMDDLNASYSSLRGAKDAFRRGNLPQVLETWIRDRNAAILCALCRQCTYRNRWNLSLSLSILPHLPIILTSIHRELRGSALFALSSIVNAVGDVVSSMTRNGVPNSIGVDIAAEDRLRMCNSIEKELVLIQLRENDMIKVMSDDEKAQLSAIIALFPS